MSEKIKSIVHDPKIAKLLIPDIPFMCKRPLFGTNYYETYIRQNVKLVSLQETPLTGFTSDGILTSDGAEHKVDVLILATGFDLFGSPLQINIRGLGGKSLREKWNTGWQSYLGLTSVDFPNLIFMNQAQSPGALASMLTVAHQYSDFVTDLLVHMRAKKKVAVTNTLDQELQWTKRISDLGSKSLFTSPQCRSFYLGNNIPGKYRSWEIFMEGVHTYQQILDKERAGAFSSSSFVFSNATSLPASDCTNSQKCDCNFVESCCAKNTNCNCVLGNPHCS